MKNLKRGGGKVKGTKRFGFPDVEQVSHGDVTHSTGNVVSNTVTAWDGVIWLLN